MPVVGRLVVRFRQAWNSVATKWQARPLMEQQSAFNRALVDWLEQPPGLADIDELFALQDRRQTAATRDAAIVSMRIDGFDRKNAHHRPRIAYFSPMPPSRSGIADYSMELLPHLSRLANVTVFADGPASVYIDGIETALVADFPLQQSGYDLPIYQMGNSDQHDAIYDILVRYPGIVVLHDYFLHHFIRHRTVGRGHWAAYGREMGYDMGSRGRRLVRTIGTGAMEPPLFDVPLNDRVIDSAVGMIVHSEFVAEHVRQARPDLPLAVIPALVELHAGHSIRSELGLPENAVIFGSFGQITAEKQIDVALRAFSGLRQSYPDARYVLAGEAQADIDLNALITGSGQSEFVHPIGYTADLAGFVNRLHSVDVVVNLRHPTVGETSAIALRAMAAARPLIVYDHGWYSELPDAAALKVQPGDLQGLQAAMATLAGSADLRRAMGKAGLEFVRAHCLPSRVAESYRAFIDNVLEPVRA